MHKYVVASAGKKKTFEHDGDDATKLKKKQTNEDVRLPIGFLLADLVL